MKNGELKIEKGVPIPSGRGRRPGPKSVALTALKVGDSVILPGAHATNQSLAMRYLGRGNYATLKEASGTRVWRTK